MAKRKTTKAARKRKGPQYETLHDLLILKLQSLRDIEEELLRALPKIAKAAHDEKLREAFSDHLERTKRHVERLEEAFKNIGEIPRRSRVEAIRGLVEDVEWCTKHIQDAAARDAMLIAAMQYVEHYEMAGYGTARTWAEEMGHSRAAELLQETLDEESEADKRLTAIAVGKPGRGGVNEQVEAGM